MTTESRDGIADIVERLRAKVMHNREGLERCSGAKFCDTISMQRRAVECACRIRWEAANEIERLRSDTLLAPVPCDSGEFVCSICAEPGDRHRDIQRSARSEIAPKGKMRVPFDLWDEIEDFIHNHVDVIDGDDGPRPNKAMHLMGRIQAEVNTPHAVPPGTPHGA